MVSNLMVGEDRLNGHLIPVGEVSRLQVGQEPQADLHELMEAPVGAGEEEYRALMVVNSPPVLNVRLLVKLLGKPIVVPPTQVQGVVVILTQRATRRSITT